jgi:hypothetical protein
MDRPFSLPDGTEPHVSRYIKFILSRPSRPKKKGPTTDLHHILPRSMGGSETKDNLISISFREHYIAHLMLWKAYGGKMVSAFHLIVYGKPSKASRDHGKRPTSRQMSVLHEEYRKECGKRTEARKAQIKRMQEGNKGKTRPSWVLEKMSSAQKGVPRNYSPEGKERRRLALSKRMTESHPMKGKKHTEETREKMRKAKEGKGASERQVEANRLNAYKRRGRPSPLIGTHRPSDVVRKIVEGLKGRPVSEETRAKMRESRMRVAQEKRDKGTSSRGPMSEDTKRKIGGLAKQRALDKKSKHTGSEAVPGESTFQGPQVLGETSHRASDETLSSGQTSRG